MTTFIESEELLLERLKESPGFGASNVQRLSGWGYNRAARQIDDWARKNKVRALEEKPYAFIVVTDDEYSPN
jgi:hypothetical protein